MADVRIDNPIINSPFDEPTRHFRFDDKGITSETVEERRPSSYFVPIPAAKRHEIAIKVVNHYGDEVMKVYEVE